MISRDISALDARTVFGGTPLHSACWNGSVECSFAMIDAGADVTAVDGRGDTPAQLAIRYGHNELAVAINEKLIKGTDDGGDDDDN